jgi:hypothetical protein
MAKIATFCTAKTTTLQHAHVNPSKNRGVAGDRFIVIVDLPFYYSQTRLANTPNCNENRYLY